ncbi:MAG: hypothetical protein HFE45_10330 [Oscillospiraceae bacterium]|nr:hypothetical protein [Oscillospiraceae bacterium]
MYPLPEREPFAPEIPMPGSVELPPLPAPGTPPLPGFNPEGFPVDKTEFGYSRFERTGSVSDYLLYKNQSAEPEGGASFDPQNPGHRPGTDAAWCPGQRVDPAYF